jgi:hypothetical protein
MVWEYYVLSMGDTSWMGGAMDAKAVSEKLNALGAGGWELVSGFPTASGEGASRLYVFLLKRAKAAGAAPPVQG